MTDNEIIKALEFCTNGDMGCEGCLLEKVHRCGNFLHRHCLDLIKRQQANISVLETEKENLRCVIDDLCNNTEYAKSEAVKEFAERIDAEIEKDKVHSIMGAPISLKRLFNYFNKIKKEMVGEDAFIEGTELALDYGLPVPDEDLKKYKELVGETK